MTRVKVCGITSINDALLATKAGADAIGLVFYHKSSRYVTIEQAAEIVAALPPFVSTVALFLNPSEDYVYEVIEEVNCDLLQFHGEEPAAFCENFNHAYIKALAMGGGLTSTIAETITDHTQSRGWLLDSHHVGGMGGSGEAFDWQTTPTTLQRPLILAGGLTPNNVAEAITATEVYGVDVSSGVESAPGIKDAEKIKHFIQEVRRVDCKQ
ncbi:MAG: phosphoribosylanthranilate isomerase [Thiotrichaceae bacterium]|nr:phosphoribosylanthranilate isomerase [Thiotrichaceae bacterium]